MTKKHFDGKVRCPQGFLPSCLLLLLAERPGHGYELADLLRSFGFEHPDPSQVYAELHRLQDAQLLESTVDEPEHGPARRVYHITQAGLETLECCWENLVELFGRVQTYVQRCHELKQR